MAGPWIYQGPAFICGEGEIRTLGGLLLTRFRGVLLRPLGHFTNRPFSAL